MTMMILTSPSILIGLPFLSIILNIPFVISILWHRPLPGVYHGCHSIIYLSVSGRTKLKELSTRWRSTKR